MGSAQSLADKIQINIRKATFHDIPELDQDVVVGRLDGTLDVTNTKTLSSGASTTAARMYLEAPNAGFFGYFDLPDLRIGMGTHSHDLSSALTINNRTRYAMWALAMSANAVDLNLHAQPKVRKVDSAPFTKTVNVDKHIQCQTPELDGLAATAQPHYGQPPCLADEYELWDGQTAICAAGCDGTIQNCPTDMPEGFTPKYGASCSDATPEFPHGLCLFHCFSDDQCGAAAVCQIDDGRLGVCTYPTNATRTTTTSTTTTYHPIGDVSMVCSFVGNADHVEPEVIV